MKKLVLLVVLSIVALLATLYFRLGANKDVVVTLQSREAQLTIFKAHLGAYHKIVPVMEEVEKWAKSNGIPCRISYGEYIDDPEVIEEDRLNSRAGCVLESGPPMVLPTGFSLGSIPKGNYAVGVFEGAPSLGPLKVYPAINDFLKDQKLERNGSIFELYEILSEKNVRTTYLFPTK